MWVRNAWYVAGWLPEFAPGSIHQCNVRTDRGIV